MNRTMEHVDCDRQFAHGTQRCKRNVHHLGLHRNARRMTDATVMWADHECTQEKGK